MIVNDPQSVEHDADIDADIDIVAIFRALWRYRYLLFVATVAAGGIAVLLALAAPLTYRAQVVVTQVSEGGMNAAASLASQFGGLASLAGVNIGRGGANRESFAVLESRRLVEEFINRNQLLPVLSRNAKKEPTLWMAVKKFKEGILSIREDKRSGVTTIAVTWNDPAVAAQWANGFVALANELLRKRALEDANRNIAYLNEQIARTKVIEVQRVMYTLIENETKTLMLANARPEYAFTVVDPAVAPEIRIGPKRTIMVLLGIVLGFAAGICIAFVHNAFVQRKLNSRENKL